MSIADLAARDGVSKPGVSRKVKQLVAKHSLQVERDGQGRVSGVNVAQYDELRSRFGDPSKAQAPQSAVGPAQDVPPATNETYDEALRQRTWIEAERARIKLATEMGDLVPSAGVADAQARCGEEISRIVDRLLNDVDEMAAAVGREGVHGLRVLIKKIVFRVKTDIANSLSSVAASATVEQGDEPEATIAPETVA